MTNVSHIALVALGGAVGAALRFLANGYTNALVPSITFPLGTFLINITGCAGIGLIAGLCTRNEVSETIRLFLVTGILGGFTTFSAFGLETISLLRAGHVAHACAYIFGSVFLGCLAVFITLLVTESKILAP